MKTFKNVVLIVLLIGIGITVFVILNKPANLLIRKAFREFAKIEFVSTKEYDQMRESNKELTAKQELSRLRQDSIEAVNKVMEKEGIEKDKRIASLRARVNNLSYELIKAKEVFDSMDVTEKFADFDQLTFGVEPTFISTHEGREVAITGPDRIMDATWKIHEGIAVKEQLEVQSEQVAEMGGRIEQLKSINLNQGLINDECRNEVQIEIQKRENCERAESETLKKARKIAGGGGLALIVSIIILIL